VCDNVCTDSASHDACQSVRVCVAVLDNINVHMQFAVFNYDSEQQLDRLCLLVAFVHSFIHSFVSFFFCSKTCRIDLSDFLAPVLYSRRRIALIRFCDSVCTTKTKIAKLGTEIARPPLQLILGQKVKGSKSAQRLVSSVM